MEEWSEGPSEQPVTSDYTHIVTCIDHHRRHLTLNHRVGQEKRVQEPTLAQCPPMPSTLLTPRNKRGRQEGADCSSHSKGNSEGSKDSLESLSSKRKAKIILFNIYAVSTANKYKCDWTKRWKKHSHRTTTLEAWSVQNHSSHLKGNKGQITLKPSISGPEPGT